MKIMMLSENFSLNEFKCHDGSKTPPDALENLKKLAVNLEVLRKHLGKPVHVNSGYRSPAYNQTLKGASPVSQHLQGKASDLKVEGVTPKALAAVIEGLIKKGLMKEGGIGIYPTFTHYDIRGTRSRW